MPISEGVGGTARSQQVQWEPDASAGQALGGLLASPCRVPDPVPSSGSTCLLAGPEAGCGA